MNTLLFILFTGAILFGLFYSFVSVVQLWRSKKRKAIASHLCPPITVLKPLKGLDDQIEQNLESFFQLDYPEFQLLFGVADSTDPVIPVVNVLRSKYPHVSSKLVLSDRKIGLNPKINNLANIVVQASHEYLLISDSNVRVRPDYLRTMAAEIDSPKVGLVTATIRGIGAKGFGAMLENLHLNTFVAGSVFAVRSLLDISISIGKSMLFRRETLDQLGGFERFANVLAEDHMLGLSIKELGLEVQTSSYIIDSINESWPVNRFANRHVRWGLMRRNFSLRDYAAELFSHPIILSALAFAIQPNEITALILSIVFIAQIIANMIAGRVIQADLPLYSYLLVPMKEVIMFGIWVIPFFKRTVEWRGHRFLVGANTRLYPVRASNQSLLDRLISWLTANGNRNVGDIAKSIRRLTRERTLRLVSRFAR
jgi:ceramide glucosyltransferase